MLCFIRHIELTLCLNKEDFQIQLDRALSKSNDMLETDFGYIDEALVQKAYALT